MRLLEAEIGTGRERGDGARARRHFTYEAATLGAVAAAGFLLSRAMIYGDFAPFGVSFLQSQHKSKRLLAAFAGVLIGYCTVWNSANGVRYIAASMISLMLKLILRQVFHTRSYAFAALSTLAAVGSTGLIWRISSGGTALTTLLYAAELLLSCVAACMFSYAFGNTGRQVETPFDREKRMMAVFTLLALCFSSFPAVCLGSWQISVGRIAAGTAVIAAAYASGVYGGVVTGLIVGLSMDLTTAVSPIYTALYAAAGLTAGAVTRRNKLVSSLLFTGVSALIVLILPQEVRMYGAIAEGLAAAAIFILLPDVVTALLPKGRTPEAESNYEERLRRHMQAKLHGLAEAYEDIAKTIQAESGGEEVNETELFATACETVCGKCENWTLCYKEIAADRGGIRKIIARGKAEPSDFCTSVRSRCKQMDAFCACVTFSLRAGRERKIRNGEHKESRELLSRQYGQLSELLDAEAVELSADMRFERRIESDVKRLVAEYGLTAEAVAYRDGKKRLHIEVCGENLRSLSERIDEFTESLRRVTGVGMCMPEQIEGKYLSCLSFTEQPEFACQIGATAEKKRSERISGDCGTYFKGKDGSMYVVLCDGMGSGTAAREEAVRTVKLLESFLRAGIEPRHAADIIQSSVKIKSDSESFATIDISVVNPKTSELYVIKYRAAPTYIRRRKGDGYVVRVIGGSGEPQLEEIAVERVGLSEGDMIVMTSDGVTAGCSQPEFCACLKKLHCDNPRELSELLLRMAKTDDEHDDRTVIALYYSKNSIPV